MTVHADLNMHHENRRVTEKKILCAIMDTIPTCTVVMNDEPYPYAVPMNYGYAWPENGKLQIFIHMYKEGHRVNLLKKDPRVCVSIYNYMDRKTKPYRNEKQDYRSINVFGNAIEVTDKTEYLDALNQLQIHNGRAPMRFIPDAMAKDLLVYKIVAEEVTGKTQYPLSGIEEVVFPVID
ncbi:MAG: pyridoxamine 5'-phosphate oxidase family protein [Clostridiales bacterium]|nr:pyridoxamine 5'-phosphate oxidase family protein [Clostridiales bacterium]